MEFFVFLLRVRSQESTIGAAFFSQTLAVSDATVKLEIWDTAGQERYHSLAPMYYRGAAAAIIVYDISRLVRAVFLVLFFFNGNAINVLEQNRLFFVVLAFSYGLVTLFSLL